MTLKVPDSARNSPYNNDFNEAKNFLEIMFRPNYAVQARELTQLQTILQNQISKFADHIFADGTQVFGGRVYTERSNFIRVEKVLSGSDGTLGTTSSDAWLETQKRTETTYEQNDANTPIQSNQFTGVLNKLQIEVYKWNEDDETYAFEGEILYLTHYLPAGYSSADDYTVLFVSAITGSSGISQNDLLKVKGQNVYFKVIDPEVIGSTLKVAYTGQATIATVDAGIFYVDGRFVQNKGQILALFNESTTGKNEDSYQSGLLYNGVLAGVRLFTSPTVRVGLLLDRTIITEDDDSTLLDPANGSYNANAPGAHRYTINLTLSQLEFSPTSLATDNYSNPDFIQLVRVVNGTTDWIRRLTNYSEILDLFARRTYDESGSYTVQPFQIEVKNHLRQDTYNFIAINTSPSDSETDYLELGKFVWSAEDADGNSTENFNPYAVGIDFSTLNFGVGEILEILPYKEEDSNLTQTNTVNPLLIKVKPKNTKRLSLGTTVNNYGSLNYARSGVVAVRNISAKLREFQIDSTGTFSAFDVPAGDPTKMILALQPGKAYVNGYEYDQIFLKTIEYDKGLSIQTNTRTIDATLSSSSILGNFVVGRFAFDDANVVIDWEKLPKFQLQTDELFTLIIEQRQLQQAIAPILGWAPYRLWNEDNTNYMKGLPNDAEEQLHDSVIFVEDDGT